MESKPKIQSRKYLMQGVWILLILLLGFSFFTPRFIEYADNDFVRGLPGIINFIAVPILVITALILSKGKFKFYFILLGILAQFAAFMISGIINVRDKYNDLQANGVWGTATVIAKKHYKLRGEIHWQIKCTFRADNHPFETRFESDNRNTYKIGDAIDILYDHDFPKIYRLKKVY
ncbi:MAG TPA: hypothetical protein VIQ77_07905 [Mucilaginibacter sp.]|jgi:hypothetical protein